MWKSVGFFVSIYISLSFSLSAADDEEEDEDDEEVRKRTTGSGEEIERWAGSLVYGRHGCFGGSDGEERGALEVSCLVISDLLFFVLLWVEGRWGMGEVWGEVGGGGGVWAALFYFGVFGLGVSVCSVLHVCSASLFVCLHICLSIPLNT